MDIEATSIDTVITFLLSSLPSPYAKECKRCREGRRIKRECRSWREGIEGTEEQRI